MVDHQWTKSVADEWRIFIPPARPSFSELSLIEEHLQDRKRQNQESTIAILGSTPEFRDLCQRVGAAYACIDYSADNFHKLGQYMYHKNQDERLLVGDWRTMDLGETFDVFLGDLATTVTPVKDHPRLFERIAAHSHANGELILKVALRTDNQRQTHEEVFTHYRAHFSHLEPFAAVWREVLLSDYDFDEDTMHCQKSEKALAQSYLQGVITEAEYLSFQKRWEALGDFRMNVPVKNEFLSNASSHFKLVKEILGQDTYVKDIPIIVLKKK